MFSTKQLRTNSYWICAAAVFALSACEVTDADLESSSLAGFSLTPASSDVDVLQVAVNGTVTLAYTSADAVDLEVFVNGASAYSESLDASTSLDLSIAAVLPLQEGANEVVAALNYNGHVLNDAFVVNVAEGAQGITLTPAASQVATFDVDVSVDTALGFLSEESATLAVQVNGNFVHSESIDASTEKTHTASLNIPLERVGPNEILATLTYQGNELTQRATVIVAPASPAVTFPAWSAAFTQTGTAAVALDPAWNIQEVAYSVDDGAFLPATSLGSGDFELSLENLDIGDSALTVRVLSENAGHVQEHLFHDVVANVAPVFDCGQSADMLPTSDLLRDNRTEIRSMLGYFGDADGGHTVTFVIRFVDDNNDQFTNPATVLTKGRNSIDVEFNVDQFRCNNPPCNDTYDLSLIVDGQTVCNQNAFGDIFEL